MRAVVIYGGTQFGHSVRQIVQGCNVLCATPGRLMDVISKEKVGPGAPRAREWGAVRMGAVSVTAGNRQ